MTSIIDEALATLSGIDKMLLSGKSLVENIGAALTDTTVTRTINGAPTLTLSVEDPHRAILRSNIFASKVTVHISPFTYEVVQLTKSGSTITVTCEDQVVAELRRHNSPLAVGTGIMTHVDFARKLVGEVRWIKFVTDPTANVLKSKEPLLRGDPSSHISSSRYESSWDALNRIAQARGWRVFVRGNNELWYVPDSFLFDSKASYSLDESNDAVDNIDFDYDIGKPVAQLNVTVRSALWGVAPGGLCVVKNLPPVNGKWIIQSISRRVTSTSTDVTLVKAQPVLPEPAEPVVVAGALPALTGTALPANFLLPLQAPPPAGSRSALPGNQQPTIGSGGGGVAPARTSSRLAADFMQEVLSQIAKAYLYGASASISNPSPDSFDCSLLVQWGSGRVGVSLPRTSGEQYALAAKHHTLISVDVAKHYRGTLLFLGVAGSQHVAISLGNGQDTIEARGKAYGVGEFSINRVSWSGAAMIPGMIY